LEKNKKIAHAPQNVFLGPFGPFYLENSKRYIKKMLGITFTVYFTRNYLKKTYRNRMKYNLFFENLGMAIFSVYAFMEL